MNTRKILFTENTVSPMLVRITLGCILFAHGAQSMLGWFDGAGFNATMQYLTTIENLPYAIAFLVIALQFFGALLLIIGLAVRPIALAVAVMFIGMIVKVHLPHGFFMNWFGTAGGEGYEYHLLVIALCTCSVVDGGGRASIDLRLAETKFAI